MTNCPWTTLPLVGLCISNSMKSHTHKRKKGGKEGRREGEKERRREGENRRVRKGVKETGWREI